MGQFVVLVEQSMAAGPLPTRGQKRLHDPFRSVNRPNSLERLCGIEDETTASLREEASTSQSRSPGEARRSACSKGATSTNESSSMRSLPERRMTSSRSCTRSASYTVSSKQNVRRRQVMAEIQDPVSDIKSSTEAYPSATTSAGVPDRNKMRPNGEFTVPTRPFT